MAMLRSKLSRQSAGVDCIMRDYAAGFEICPLHWELGWKHPTPTEGFLAIGPLNLFAIRISELMKDLDR